MEHALCPGLRRIADLIREGALYDDLLRAAIDRGHLRRAEGERDDDNLQRRLDRPLTEIWDDEDELADGRLIWVRERATPSRETVGLYEDVTARRLADRRLQQVVDGGEIAVWDWECDARLQRDQRPLGDDAGPWHVAARLTGLIELVHPEDRMAVIEAQRDALSDGGDGRVRPSCAGCGTNGSWVWLSDPRPCVRPLGRRQPAPHLGHHAGRLDPDRGRTAAEPG